MEDKEAIEILKECYTSNVEIAKELASKKQHEGTELALQIARALAKAISALEKQTPQKPILRDKNDDVYDCPVCGGVVSIYDYSDDYCSNCGQRIDWKAEGGENA